MLVGIVLVYLAVLLGYGLVGTQKTRDSRVFLTNNASTGVLFCALSLVSTIVGGSATLGMGALAQKTGAAAFWWLGVGAVGLALHGWLMAPKIRAMGAVTLPEVVGRYAGRAAERWSAGIIAVAWVAVTAAQFVALYTLLVSLAGEATARWLYGAIAAAVVIHTAAGGQRSVIRTDALQTVLLVGGFTATAFWLLTSGTVDLTGIDPVPFNENFGAYDWGRLMLLVGITYIVGPDMFSRSFSAASPSAARRAALWAAPCLIWFGAVITLMALTNLDAASPVADWLSPASPLPIAFKAVLTLGLVSALCGSADTVLLSASGIFERDILAGNSARRIQALVLGIGLAAAATVFVSRDIIGLLLKAYALYVPGVAVPLLVVLLGRTRTVHRGLWLGGAVAGGLMGLAAVLWGVAWLTVAGMAVSAGAALASRILGRETEKSFTLKTE